MSLKDGDNPAYYPIGLDLRGATVLMVGAGAIAARKLARLCQTGARITVVSRDIRPVFAQALADAGHPESVSVTVRDYPPDLLQTLEPVLVFACTDDPILNAQIAKEAHEKRIWINSATDGVANGNVIIPSVLDYSPLQIALFSGGTSPMFLRRLRQTLAASLGPWVPAYLDFLGWLRTELQAQLPMPAQRRAALAQVLEDENLLAAFQTGEGLPEPAAREALLARLVAAAWDA